MASLGTSSASLKSLTQHVSKIRMLSEADELSLIHDYKTNGNKAALQKLIESHLGLIINCAKKIPLGAGFIEDLINEGVLGFIRAVENFEENKNRRLSVIAKFHVKAWMQDYALLNLSPVKPFNSRKQRRAFFHFKKNSGSADRLMTAEERNALAVELGIDDSEIAFVSARLDGGDVSVSDTLVDEAPLPDDRLIMKDERISWTMRMRVALSLLPDRERDILSARRLKEPPISLQTLAEQFNVSKGRISQIESEAFEKLKRYVMETEAQPSRFER